MPIFGERWPLVYFDLSGHCFGFLGGGEVRVGVERNQFVRGAIYHQLLENVASSPFCATNPPGLVRACFWLSPDFVAGCVARFVTDGVVRCSNSGF